ncbi:MAG: hypothetical protein B6I34_00900 [Anaerolineaceae bacterium 4572_32.1]|nr:MAG: hypothetical protein B6I34_00900 [Anaerolineaceae bacterium 4572_32.1]
MSGGRFVTRGDKRLQIQERVEGHITVLTISGRIDSRTAREFETRLRDAINDASPWLLLDMKDVEYITSAGMRVLASTYKVISKFGRGDIAIAGMKDDLVHLFRLIGFDGLFTLYESVGTALQKMCP